MKIKLKLTLMQTCGFVVAGVVLYHGGWILTLIICAVAAPVWGEVSDENAFINIDTSRD